MGIDMATVANTTDRRDIYIYSNNSTEENIDFNLELIVQSGGNDSVSAADINFDSAVDIFDLLLLSDYLQNM
jgi:hypothetical protein